MRQTEIPREQWQTFCEEFTRQHHAWIVNLSASDAGAGISDGIPLEVAEQYMHLLSRSAVFQRIAAEPRDGNYAISMVVGVSPAQVTHTIDEPRHLFFLNTDEGAHGGLFLASDSGQVILLRFRSAASPETLDGLSEVELELSSLGIA